MNEWLRQWWPILAALLFLVVALGWFVQRMVKSSSASGAANAFETVFRKEMVQQISDGPNHGRRSCKLIQDCTIRHSYHWAAACFRRVGIAGESPSSSGNLPALRRTLHSYPSDAAAYRRNTSIPCSFRPFRLRVRTASAFPSSDSR